jgi:hypothetical protein
MWRVLQRRLLLDNAGLALHVHALPSHDEAESRCLPRFDVDSANDACSWRCCGIGNVLCWSSFRIKSSACLDYLGMQEEMRITGKSAVGLNGEMNISNLRVCGRDTDQSIMTSINSGAASMSSILQSCSPLFLVNAQGACFS